MNPPGSASSQSSPAFGQADLSNCERELIHLAGSVQPHGLLMVLREPGLRVLQVSANVGALLGLPLDSVLGLPLTKLGGDLAAQVVAALALADSVETVPLRCHISTGAATQTFEGALFRIDAGIVGVEIEPVLAPRLCAPTVALSGSELQSRMSQAVQQFSAASTIGVLADAVVKNIHELVGYDRVMVYKFDPDGHGKIIAEARDPRLESLLGHHYPATDIPQRARELYVRNRVRVLVDVHYQPSPLVPRLVPGSEQELDMSMSYLRSMSPLHLQYLKNMGVTATLVVSLVREGRLWGLIACHHYSPRNLRMAVRTATDLLAEVITTRIAAIENYARAQVAIQVRRLEQRLIEATSIEGDWRLALFRNPRTLLQPLDATGVALFHDGEILTTGEVPSTPELRAVKEWVDGQRFEAQFECSSVSRHNPALASLTPTASGVLAVKLSTSRPDYLMWFRKEQLLTVTWAGDPHKPMVGNDPMELSPRRSFAAWSELVRGTAMPWSSGELTLARAFGDALIDIIVQINAVRLLIAEHQLSAVREGVADSKEPVVVADTGRRAFFANGAFLKLARRQADDCRSLDALVELFAPPDAARRMIDVVRAGNRSWRGELTLVAGDNGALLPVSARVEAVPARDGSLLGFIFIFNDLSDVKRADAARHQLEAALSQVGSLQLPLDTVRQAGADVDNVVGAILANASLAAMDIADGGAAPAVAPLLQELESSTKRATALYAHIRSLAPGG